MIFKNCPICLKEFQYDNTYKRYQCTEIGYYCFAEMYFTRIIKGGFCIDINHKFDITIENHENFNILELKELVKFIEIIEKNVEKLKKLNSFS